jgi:hypothetical protein
MLMTDGTPLMGTNINPFSPSKTSLSTSGGSTITSINPLHLVKS